MKIIKKKLDIMLVQRQNWLWIIKKWRIPKSDTVALSLINPYTVLITTIVHTTYVWEFAIWVLYVKIMIIILNIIIEIIKREIVRSPRALRSCAGAWLITTRLSLLLLRFAVLCYLCLALIDLRCKWRHHCR